MQILLYTYVYDTKKYVDIIHSVINLTPKYPLFGTDVTILFKEFRAKNQYSDWIRDRKTVLDNTMKSYDYNKKIFDKNRNYYEFNMGGMV